MHSFRKNSHKGHEGHKAAVTIGDATDEFLPLTTLNSLLLAICEICGYLLSSVLGLLQLHRFEFGEDVADENVCLDPQRDAFVVIR